MKYNQPYGVSDPDAPYVNGNPSTGTMGSIPPAMSVEGPQREIVNLITHAGLVNPDNADLHQLARSVQSMLMNAQDDVGTVNNYQVTMKPAPNDYYKYLMVIMEIGVSNTGPSVLNVNAMGAKPIVKVDGSAINADDMKQGAIVCLMFDGVNFQLVWSSTGVSGVPGAPVYLTAPKDIYVNWGTGNDTYDGTAAAFTTGIKGPFKSLQRATDEINKYNLNGFSVTVHVADNTGYNFWWLPNPSGNGNVFWQGNNANPAAVTVTGVNHSALLTVHVGDQYVYGMKLISTGSMLVNNDSCNCVQIAGSGRLNLTNINYGGSLGPHIYVAGGRCVLYGTQTISGGSPGGPIMGSGAHIYCIAGQIGVDGLQKPSLNITTPVTFSMFILGNYGASCYVGYTSITGAGNVTGQKYNATTNSVIDSFGGGVNYYPGTVAGAVSSGGQYV